MKKMVCEICNSQNIKKENGMFVCKECGTEYSLEEAKKLIKDVEDINGLSTSFNIDSLIETGNKIIKKFPVDNSQINLLKDIKEKILLNDYENIYGKLFESIIEIHLCKTDLKHIDYIINQNNNLISDKIFEALLVYLKNSLKFLEQIEDSNSLYAQIELIDYKYLSFLEPLKKHYNDLNDEFKNIYDNIINDLKLKSEHVLELVYNRVNNFIFTTESVKKYEYTHNFISFISKTSIFVNSIRKYIDPQTIDSISKKIFEVIKSNRDIIMSNSGFGGILIESAGKLACIDEKTINELINSYAKTITGCLCVGNQITLKLYGDKAIITGIGPERNIPAKNILKINCKSTACFDKYSNIKTTYWWDFVYKINNETYTVLHFCYVLKPSEDSLNCVQWMDTYEWGNRIGVTISNEDYNQWEQYTHGIGSLTYVNTMDQYSANTMDQYNVSQTSHQSGCYIATCVYGSYDCPQVWRLRRYRDYYLDNKWYGRLFIKIYYFISPTLVKLFGKKEWFKKPLKKLLDKKLVKLEREGYEDTAYTDKY